MGESQRYEWVDYAKGICILAVVCLYVNSNAIHHFGSSGWVDYFVSFARPFRMPDFFLLSGLFVARAIDKPWLHYLDRKILHYFYFYLLWTFISWVILIFTGQLNEDVVGLIKSFISMAVIWPFHQLWFILMLPLYFLVTRLTRKLPVWFMFPALCVLHLLANDNDYKVGYTVINDFNDRFVFFYSGYVFARYIFAFTDTIGANILKASIGVLLWGVINAWLVFNGYSQLGSVNLILGFAGCMAVITIATLLMQIRYGFKWLSYLGAHSIAIYLPFDWLLNGVLAQSIGLWDGIDVNIYVFTMWIFAIFLSLSLYWLRKPIPLLGLLFERPDWLKVVK